MEREARGSQFLSWRVSALPCKGISISSANCIVTHLTCSLALMGHIHQYWMGTLTRGGGGGVFCGYRAAGSFIPKLIFPGFYHLQYEKWEKAWTGTSRETDCPSSQHVTSVVTSCIVTSLLSHKTRSASFYGNDCC